MKDRKLFIVISIIIALILADELYFALRSLLEVSEYLGILNFQWYLRTLVCLYGTTGLIIMLVSQFTKTSVFRSYCVLMIGSFPGTVWYYKVIYFDEHIIRLSSWFYVGVLAELLLFAGCCILLWKLTRLRRIKFNYTEFAGETFAEFSPVTAWKRLIHYIIDSAAMVYICYNLIKMADYAMRVNQHYITDYIEPVHALFITELIGVGIFLVYYTIFETVFRTSAGKCLTNTIIVNERGENAGIGQLIGRTFCRLIPFDPLSFFAENKRGWHDTITDTYVVDSVSEGEKNEEQNNADLLSGKEIGLTD